MSKVKAINITLSISGNYILSAMVEHRGKLAAFDLANHNLRDLINDFEASVTNEFETPFTYLKENKFSNN